MRCAAILANLTNRAPVVMAQSSQYYDYILNAGGQYYAAGTYTLSADLDPEEGKTITCYADAYDTWNDIESHIGIPTTGEAELPFTFTLSTVKKVQFFFGYAGFRSAEYGEGDPIDTSAVTNIKIAAVGKPEAETYDTVALAPEEIEDSDVLSQAVNSKSSALLRVLPCFEAFGFAVRGLTLVRIYDLDLPENRCIFKGRVSAVSDIMDRGGTVAQELTCMSSADFLEDTSFSDSISSQTLSEWLGSVCSAHNSDVELARRFTFTVAGTASVSSGGDYICKTDYGVISDVLTGGKYLTTSGTPAAWEWRERYQNDVFYLDVAAKIGADKDTPIVIGENLKNIKIDRMTDGGIYTTVRAVSGVNADGYRYSLTAANNEMFSKYGSGHELVIINDDIYFTGPGGRDYTSGGGYNWYVTPAVAAMEEALRAWAEREAAKLSDPPVTITLGAADLAAMGYSGYERFEVGNSHPVVYPPGGLYGQRLRITGIKRRLSDGRIEQITIAKGTVVGAARAGTLSAQLSRLAAANSAAADDSKIVEIVDGATGGLSFDPLTQAEFDELSEKDDNTIYYVDDDGDISIYKGDTHISTGGGGGDEPTIETAAVLTSEQMQTWAPQHALVPVEFRGSAMVYYAQAPARVVIQGQRALFGVNDGMVSGDDIMSEVIYDYPDGARQKIKAFIRGMTATSVSIAAAYYDVSGAAETRLGYTTNYRINIPYGWQSLKVGIAIHVQNYYLNENDEFAANIQAKLYIFINGSLGAAGQLIGAKYSGGQVTTVGIEFGSAAERGFASGISRRTEPAYPNSVEEGDSE